MDSEKKQCAFYLSKGAIDIYKCKKNVSGKDPEGKYCSSHRVCELIFDDEIIEGMKVSIEKYLDYETFRASLI